MSKNLEVEQRKLPKWAVQKLDVSPDTAHLLHIGEGDSRLVLPFLPDDEAENIFEQLRTEVQWQSMHHIGGAVPRLVAVQGILESDGSHPVYRHPADQSPPLLPFSPTVQRIRDHVERVLQHPVNHCLVQLYRSGNDSISEHSDKTLDVVPGSSICNVSFGAERFMRLRTKRAIIPTSASGETSMATTPTMTERETQRIPLPHNSLLVMGLATNACWLHAIQPDKRDDRDRSAAELAYEGQRISLTFRQIGSFVDADETIIWGQGATGHTRDTAHKIIHGDPIESQRLLEMYGRENREASSFDWKEVYGAGSDVLHLISQAEINAAATTTAASAPA